jgi:hypothetical protein
VLDLSGAVPGERTYGIREADVHLPRGLNLIRAIPSQLRFVFEHHRERTVPVEVRFMGTPASFEVTPRVMTIEGPESSVKRTSAVVTDQIDVGKVTGTATFQVNTYSDDPRIRIKSESVVNVKVTARPT